MTVQEQIDHHTRAVSGAAAAVDAARARGDRLALAEVAALEAAAQARDAFFKSLRQDDNDGRSLRRPNGW